MWLAAFVVVGDADAVQQLLSSTQPISRSFAETCDDDLLGNAAFCSAFFLGGFDNAESALEELWVLAEGLRRLSGSRWRRPDMPSKSAGDGVEVAVAPRACFLTPHLLSWCVY